MDPDRAYERAELLKAFAHPTRLQILAELAKGTRCVTDMEDILPVTQVNISQHLTVLRNAKLVDFAQDGGTINLLKEEQRIGIEINMEAAHRSRLKISSKLLALAKIVTPGRR